MSTRKRYLLFTLLAALLALFACFVVSSYQYNKQLYEQKWNNPYVDESINGVINPYKVKERVYEFGAYEKTEGLDYRVHEVNHYCFVVAYSLQNDIPSKHPSILFALIRRR